MTNSDKLKNKVTASFYYDGKLGRKDDGEYQGTFINEVCVRMEKKAKANNEWWSHFSPVHQLNGFSKEDLWENVKAVALQTRSKAVVLIHDQYDNEKLVTLS